MPNSVDLMLFEKIERTLCTPVISDSLDAVGHRGQAMSSRIRPPHENFTLVGPARTVTWVDVYAPDPHPYEKEIEFMDRLKPGDIVVTNTDAQLRNTPWGELMSTASKCRGAHGAIIDSCVRDVKKIFELGFPVFATAVAPLDSCGRGRVIGYDEPVESGGVHVETGDLVVGDYDGVVVIPKSAEKVVMEKAFDKATKEKKSKAELLRGKMLKDVYNKYGVL